MMEATVTLSLDELTVLREALTKFYDGAPSSLINMIDVEIEKLDLVDMSDWNDCGDSCKL